MDPSQIFHGGRSPSITIKDFLKATKILELSLNYSEIRHRLENDKPLPSSLRGKEHEVFGVRILQVSYHNLSI